MASKEIRGFIEILKNSEEHYSRMYEEELEKWEINPLSKKQRTENFTCFDPSRRRAIQDMATKLRNSICFIFLATNGLRYDVFCNMTEEEFLEGAKSPFYSEYNGKKIKLRCVKVHKHKTRKPHGSAEVFLYPELWNICWKYMKVWKKPFVCKVDNESESSKPFFIRHKRNNINILNEDNNCTAIPVYKSQNEVRISICIN